MFSVLVMLCLPIFGLAASRHGTGGGGGSYVGAGSSVPETQTPTKTYLSVATYSDTPLTGVTAYQMLHTIQNSGRSPEVQEIAKEMSEELEQAQAPHVKKIFWVTQDFDKSKRRDGSIVAEPEQETQQPYVHWSQPLFKVSLDVTAAMRSYVSAKIKTIDINAKFSSVEIDLDCLRDNSPSLYDIHVYQYGHNLHLTVNPKLLKQETIFTSSGHGRQGAGYNIQNDDKLHGFYFGIPEKCYQEAPLDSQAIKDFKESQNPTQLETAVAEAVTAMRASRGGRGAQGSRPNSNSGSDRSDSAAPVLRAHRRLVFD